MLIAMLFISSCAREKELVFDDWDEDGNGKIELKEFTKTFMANYYDDWNNTDNDYLDDEDFYKVTYALWDADGDGVLGAEEYQVGYKYQFGNYTKDDYEVIDVDKDSYISYEEFRGSVDDTFYYSDWDINNDDQLSDEELAIGVFENWDYNDDLVIDPEEYMAFDNYYLDI